MSHEEPSSYTYSEEEGRGRKHGLSYSTLGTVVILEFYTDSHSLLCDFKYPTFWRGEQRNLWMQCVFRGSAKNVICTVPFKGKYLLTPWQGKYSKKDMFSFCYDLATKKMFYRRRVISERMKIQNRMSFWCPCIHSKWLTDNQNRKRIAQVVHLFKQMGNYNLGQPSRHFFFKWSNFSTFWGLKEKECEGIWRLCIKSQFSLSGNFQKHKHLLHLNREKSKVTKSTQPWALPFRHFK